MNKLFKKTNGEVVNVLEHTLNILREYPSIRVHIGTDSQNYQTTTVYVTAIAYRYRQRGVHYIIYKQKVPKIKAMWDRLFKEAEMSIETAQWLTSNMNINIEIDMDYNSDKSYQSSKLISATKGWGNSLGYKVNVKPEIQIATRAADFWCIGGY